MKPNCYDCIHRREVPGSAHSRCVHPDIPALNSKEELFAIMGVAPPSSLNAMRELKITAVPHGVRMGWFVWPVNFDPVWLQQCDGFTAKANKVVEK